MRGGRDFETIARKDGTALGTSGPGGAPPARCRGGAASSWPGRPSKPAETASPPVLRGIISMPHTPKVYGVKSLLNSRSGYGARR